MKIVHVGWGYPPQWMGCGPVVYVHQLARSQAAAGHFPVVACASDRAADGGQLFDPMAVSIDGVAYIHVRNRPAHMHDYWNPGREASNPQCAAAFEDIFEELGPDVVHIHNLVGLSFDVVGAARRAGARVLASLHNYFPICSRDDLFFANAERCAGPLERSCSSCLGTGLGDEAYRRRHLAGVDALNACDVLLAVSQRVAEIYTAQGVDRALLSVDRIGSVAAEALWRDMGHARVRAAEGHHSPLRLVFFGSLTPRKGIVAFLQGIRLLAHPEQVEAHVYGGASTEVAAQLETVLAHFSPAHAACVRFHGAFTQQDLATILRDMDVAVLPPRWEDNGPQTVMEAQAAGLPVVATGVGGIPDVIEDGRNGLLVEDGEPALLAQAIDRLVTEPGLTARLQRGIRPPLTMDEHRLVLERHYQPQAVGELASSLVGGPGVV